MHQSTAAGPLPTGPRPKPPSSHRGNSGPMPAPPPPPFTAQQTSSSVRGVMHETPSPPPATQPGPAAARQLDRARQTTSGGASPVQHSGGVVEPNREHFVTLNPPRSNTKGRKKGRIPSGIELQAKKINLCGLCSEPGHNAATCTSGLGHK